MCSLSRIWSIISLPFLRGFWTGIIGVYCSIQSPERQAGEKTACMKYVHHRPPGPDAGGLPGGWDTHNGLAEPYFYPFSTTQRKILWACFGTAPGRGVRRIICFGMGLTLREGNREYFFQPIGPAFPRPFGPLPALLWKCLRGSQPQGKGADEPDGGVLPGTGICMDLQENFHFLREFPNKLEERQMKLW